MDIEQLKLILETIGAAGDGALWFGILWLSKGIIIASLWIGLIMYAMKIKIAPFFVNLSLIETIKDFMGFRGELTRDESEKILDALKFCDDVLVSAGISYEPSTKERDKILGLIREGYKGE